ncbi:SPX domain-containing protein [Mycena olivaceomarginata]|nr:SPX domain-containing protein [Mycena olivaceomarginata]
MKFSLRKVDESPGSSSLKFNAVAEWWEEYIAYDTLKKYIYQLERTQHEQAAYRDIETNERTSLVDRGPNAESVFTPLLDRELKKICTFYEAQENELKGEVAELEELVRQQEEAGMAGNHYLDEDDDEDDEDDDDSLSRSPQRRRRVSSSANRLSSLASQTIPEDEAAHFRRFSVSSASSDGHPEREPSSPTATGPRGTLGKLANRLPLPNFMQSSITSSTSVPENVWTSKSDYAYDTRLLFKRRITTLYITATSLKSYVEVNYSGFRKILKKYDKVTEHELKDAYLHASVEPAAPFTPAARATLNALTTRLIDLYTKCVARGDRAVARQQLKLHQRENIAWERDTVWRQMIGRERRGGDVVGPGASLVRTDEDDDALGDGNLKAGSGGAQSGLCKAACDEEKGRGPDCGGGVRVVAEHAHDRGPGGGESVLCGADVLHAAMGDGGFARIFFLAIPLFVTSLMVPLLLVCFSVIRDDQGTSLSAPDATKFIFSVMFSPTIMLLIGGFTISSALSKTAIDRVLITRVLSLAGTRPSTVLLAFMGVSCFARADDGRSNVAAPTLCFTLIRPILRTLPPKSSFAPCLIRWTRPSAGVNGSSSRSPVSFISILLIWGLLLASYKPARAPDGGRDIEIKLIRPTRERFTLKQWWVTLVCLVTIALWCFAHEIKDYVGDMGVIAIIPIVAFFATGVLKKDDFEQFAWTIVFLAMGGIALGKGVTQSGLLEVLDGIIRDLLDGVSPYNVVLILSPVVLVISTFISHTIASVLLVPIAKEVGSQPAWEPREPPDLHNGLDLLYRDGHACVGLPEPDSDCCAGQHKRTIWNGVPASIIATLVRTVS